MSLEARAGLPDISELISQDACNSIHLGTDGKLDLEQHFVNGFHSDRQLNNQLWDTDTDGTQDIALRSATITNPSSCRQGFVIIRVWHGKIWFRDQANVGDFTIRYYPRFTHNLTATPPATAAFDQNWSIGYRHPQNAGADTWACMNGGFTDRIVPVGAGGSVSCTIGGMFAVPRPTSVVGSIRYYIWKESISMFLVTT